VSVLKYNAQKCFQELSLENIIPFGFYRLKTQCSYGQIVLHMWLFIQGNNLDWLCMIVTCNITRNARSRFDSCNWRKLISFWTPVGCYSILAILWISWSFLSIDSISRYPWFRGWFSCYGRAEWCILCSQRHGYCGFFYVHCWFVRIDLVRKF